MQRASRLRRRSDFSAAYQRGRAWSNELLAVRVLANGLPVSRFGFAVGKRVGKAVERNRVKRRLREIVRSLDPAGGWDVVIIARPAAATADFSALTGAVRSLFGRAGLVERVQSPVSSG
jgi:ribonuclease P protein component